jgi:hypothetical protein
MRQASGWSRFLSLPLLFAAWFKHLASFFLSSVLAGWRLLPG